ncbi:hypothetical protein Clacol_003699 [Clathrus columnatus]|uniref:Protein kinase domain-containing protein n=1 Tax=Clathrus columnatus TaxID=1419009 RepID=A0AAV5A8Y4_9AGAM|nr:hypothetical protein Clacol_003699 [Clathrus columnatus]
MQPCPSNNINNTTTHPKDRQIVEAIPSVSLVGDRLIIGDANSTSIRSWTSLKVVGDGSFGTVWLCDWHGTLPPSTSLSPMQCGAGARPEWAGKRLVAVKRMKKRWEGGWDECRRLKELESLHAIPSHPNIIPLYDSFLLPSTKELYFVFECMEGNLYQLIKSRKGRPLAGGLVSSIYSQVVKGLHHIHQSGFFHRDMKPENLLVTTTGLTDYPQTSPIALPNASPERDVVVIIKLADFGLARETSSEPPYTEYVSTRWYRAPEVLLRSRDYSNPVDMWALGTILAELINLKPLFPGAGEIDQVARICEVLGDPCHDYGVDQRGRTWGGGLWMRGVQLARQVGCTFPKIKPRNLRSFFDASIPSTLIDCIEDLLRYDPERRLTSKQCLNHPYIIETSQLTPDHTMLQQPPLSNRTQRPTPAYADSLPSVPPRSLPPSHSQSVHFPPRPAFNGEVQGHISTGHHASSSYPSIVEPHPQYPLSVELAKQLRETDYPLDDLASYGHRSPPSPSSLYSFPAVTDRRLRQHTISPDVWTMEISPVPDSRGETSPESHDSPMDVPQSPIVLSLPPDDEPTESSDSIAQPEDLSTPVPQHSKFGKLGALGFGKRHNKWGLPLFGHGNDKHVANPLPPVDELNVAVSRSTPSLKRTQSGNTSDSLSLPDVPSAVPAIPLVPSSVDSKKLKKERERLARDAEKARREQEQKSQRERSRAVMQKRHQILKQNAPSLEIDWQSSRTAVVARGAPANGTINKGKQPAELLPPAMEREEDQEDWLSHRSKARRRDLDDDHSMSSSEVHSISRMSMISFASGESDPGPTRTFRPRPVHNVYNIPRATSISSLRTSSGRGFSSSARSSNSFDRQFIREFRERATFGPESSLPDTGSPPPIHELSLSPNHSHSHYHSTEDKMYLQPGGSLNPQLSDSRFGSLPPITTVHPPQPKHYEIDTLIEGQPISHPTIHPMFQVPPFPSPPVLPTHHPSHRNGSLPPFSQLLSVADQQQYPQSFETPKAQ